MTTTILALDLGQYNSVPGWSDTRDATFRRPSPREFRSGTSVRKMTRLSKAGNARLRKALFLPTLTAIRCNPVLQAFFERLGAGKPMMAVVAACSASG